MGFTPFARVKNITLQNLKMYLAMYPELLFDPSWDSVITMIDSEHKGYKRSYYQQTCQLGLENRTENRNHIEKYEYRKYLQMFDDDSLNKYLNFWFKLYYVPNPYAPSKTHDKSVILFCEYGKMILASEHFNISFLEAHRAICGDGASEDIELNAFKNFGDPIKHKRVGKDDFLYVERQDVEKLRNIIDFIERNFPIETDITCESFFKRFSYKEYAKYYGIVAPLAECEDNGDAVFMQVEAQKEISLLPYPHNRILYGAPGTGKSYQLTNELEELSKGFSKSEYVRRVTFHPAYTYSQFFGSYKPVSEPKADEKAQSASEIEYRYVPGPLLQTIMDAKINHTKSYVLIIEEINRANVAAVFGDAFQLLDRDDDGNSEYEITASKELASFYFRHTGKKLENNKLGIPANMYIWATMNSADQGVMPLDTAFKRRWDLEYIGVNGKNEKETDELLKDYVYDISVGDMVQRVSWNGIRKNINDKMERAGINEDKWLGPFFISKSTLNKAKEDSELFVKVFKNKVLMYLYEDAARYNTNEVLGGEYTSLSKLFDKFDKKGMEMFGYSEENEMSTEV